MLRHRFTSQGQRNNTSSRCSWKFSYASLQIATDNFSDDNLIDVSGSARTYKGILANGMKVAIKKYGELNPLQREQFLDTVKVMSQIRHRFINQVIGYCMENDHWLLVTEYVENGTLSDLLQDLERRKSEFNWNMRASVCIGIARGLSYLHEDMSPSVIHGNIRSSNILFDTNFTPKIKYLDCVDCLSDSNQYREKVDVYGFGVVMLEIISGRKFTDSAFVDDKELCSMVHWASTQVKYGKTVQIVDPVLVEFPEVDVQRFIYVALLCTLRRRDLRPSMPEIVLMLHGSCQSCWFPTLMKLDAHFPAGTGCLSSTRQILIDDVSCRNTRKLFSYAVLQIASDNFSNDMLIGEGGSARIYKGVLRNGTVVAVKKYNEPKSTQFRHELSHIVSVMSEFQHQNINQVIGCCIEQDHRLLVTEYAENGSLWDLLQNPDRKELFFNWQRRAAVCIGIAQGLYFLHEDANPHVVHRDIKSSNVLLDIDFTPKIADFDTLDYFRNSNEFPRKSDEPVIGTLGYLDPHYSITSQYTEKVDVYSFGVVMLEIISGRNAIIWELDDDDDRLITRWASKLKKSGRAQEIVDPMLRNFPTNDVQHFINVALSCTQLKLSLRPRMRDVVLMLHGDCNSSKISPRDIMPITDDRSNFPEGYSIGAEYVEQSLGCSDQVDIKYFHDMIMPLIMRNILKSKGVETSRTQEDRADELASSTEQQSLTAIDLETYFHKSMQQLKQKQRLRILRNGSDNIAQRLSQTMVIRKTFEEAVYPPFITRAYPQLGPKHLFTS